MDKYDYAELTDEIKDQILGLNAAKLFGIDPRPSVKAIKTDKLSQLARSTAQTPTPRTRSTAGCGEDGGEPTIPVGPS